MLLLQLLRGLSLERSCAPLLSRFGLHADDVGRSHLDVPVSGEAKPGSRPNRSRQAVVLYNRLFLTRPELQHVAAV